MASLTYTVSTSGMLTFTCTFGSSASRYYALCTSNSVTSTSATGCIAYGQTSGSSDTLIVSYSKLNAGSTYYLRYGPSKTDLKYPGTAASCIVSWVTRAVKVTFNKNGGTGTITSPITQTNYYKSSPSGGATIAVSVSGNNLTGPSGYTFQGWGLSTQATSYSKSSLSFSGITGTASSPTAKNAYAVHTATRYGYAICDKNAADASSGSLTESEVKNITVKYSNTSGVFTDFKITSSYSPTRTGYTFLGWSTSSTASSPDSGKAVSDLPFTFNITCASSASTKAGGATKNYLYAVWSEDITYPTTTNTTTATRYGTSLNFTVNAGSSAQRTWKVIWSSSSAALDSVKWNPSTISSGGILYSGTSLSSSASSYTFGTSTTHPINNLTRGVTYYYKGMYSTMLYNGTNGTVYCNPGRTDTPHSITIPYLINYDARGGTPSFATKEVATAGSTEIGTLPSATRTASEISKVTYSVTFDPNYSGGTSSSKYATATETTTYTFNGWYKTTSGGTRLDTTTKVSDLTWSSGQTTLYVHWTENSTTGDSHVQLPTAPTRTHYTFAGWYTLPSGGTQVTASTVISSNMTVYAHWTPDSIDIKYNANGGTGTISPTKKYYGIDAILSNGNGFSRTGYEIDGWATTSTGSVAYSLGGIYTIDSTTDVTLYAHWKQSKAHLTVMYVDYDSDPPRKVREDDGDDYNIGATVTTSNYVKSVPGYYYHSASQGATFTINGDMTLYLYYKAYSTTDTATVTIVERTSTTITVRVKPNESRPYSRSVYVNILSKVGPYTIFANSTAAIDITVTSLTPGTMYTAILAWIENPSDVETWRKFTSAFTKFDFTWTTDDASKIKTGQPFCITASKWNTYMTNLDKLCQWKSVTRPTIDEVSADMEFKHEYFNHSVDGMTSLGYSNPPRVAKGTICYALYFKNLKDNLNNT